MQKLSEQEVQGIISSYQEGLSVDRVAEVTHHSPNTILEVLRERGVPTRHGHEVPAYLPTPWDIAEQAAAIRSRWSRAEERSRRVEKVGHCTVPTCKVLTEVSGSPRII